MLAPIYVSYVLSSVLDAWYYYISGARSRSLIWVQAITHRLNMELDRQKLFGLLFTAVLIGRDPATPTRGAIGQPRKTSLCNFLLLQYHESMSTSSSKSIGARFSLRLSWGYAHGPLCLSTSIEQLGLTRARLNLYDVFLVMANNWEIDLRLIKWWASTVPYVSKLALLFRKAASFFLFIKFYRKLRTSEHCTVGKKNSRLTTVV